MADKQHIEPSDGQTSTGAYSPGILADGWLYISGQGPIDPGTGQAVLGSIEEETERTLRNIQAIVEAAGGCIGDIVKCAAHLSDINDFDRFNQTYAQFFEATQLPARTTVQSGLGMGIKVEIDAVARIGCGR